MPTENVNGCERAGFNWIQLKDVIIQSDQISALMSASTPGSYLSIINAFTCGTLQEIQARCVGFLLQPNGCDYMWSKVSE